MTIGAGAHGPAHRWSRAIYDAFPRIVGLRYASSKHANRPCFAFYDRADPGIDADPMFDEPLAHPELEPLLKHAAHVFGYDLGPSPADTDDRP